MNRQSLISLVGSFIIALTLAACGGGGGGSGAPPAPSGTSTWDQMIWDQDKWG